MLVRLKPKRDSTRPNPEGEIVEVIERRTQQFVGTYFESAGTAYVQVDGKPFSRPILVGDPGAKNAQPDDKVVIEMVRFPSHYQDGEGVIIEVLGPRGTPGVDTLSIIREFNLPEGFAEDAQEEARLEAEKFDESIPPERTDLTGEVIITIDPVDARDFDDAISLVRDRQGALAVGRAHCRRVALHPAAHGARSRGDAARHERLSARPRAADAARADLERPGQLAARPGALHQDGVHRVHARGDSGRRRRGQRRRSAAGGGSPMKRSTSFWPIASRGARS